MAIIDSKNNDMIKTMKGLQESSESLLKTFKDLGLDKENKEEFEILEKSANEIKQEFDTIATIEEEVKKYSGCSAFIKQLEEVLEDDSQSEELKEKIKRQIFMIKSSYNFKAFSELQPTLKPKTLLNNYKALRNKAENKLKNNNTFTFNTSFYLEKMIKGVLPDDLKSYSRMTASYIYAFINTASLKRGGYAIFVGFLINNINNLDKEYPEKEELVNNLIKLTQLLKDELIGSAKTK
ncbi:hypothetical protein Goe21_01390 [Bacillus phage vB_BsuM-Goe21]|nr:hypothetical protein Goe21_01390 [Bacillus phage vB_BsuM-Goe21]